MRDDEKIARLKKHIRALAGKDPKWSYRAGRTILNAEEFIGLLDSDKKFRQKMLDSVDSLSIELLSRQVK